MKDTYKFIQPSFFFSAAHKLGLRSNVVQLCETICLFLKKLTSVLSFNVLKKENIHFLSYVSLFSNAESSVESNYLNYFQLPGSSAKNGRLSAQNSNLSFSCGFCIAKFLRICTLIPAKI
jgi:hypothetical protein